VQEVFGFVKGNLSEAQRRKNAANGERGAGKGGSPFLRLSTQKSRRALARRLSTAAFFAHGITTHLDAMSAIALLVLPTYPDPLVSRWKLIHTWGDRAPQEGLDPEVGGLLCVGILLSTQDTYCKRKQGSDW
jgi:hypothetical protein